MESLAKGDNRKQEQTTVNFADRFAIPLQCTCIGTSIGLQASLDTALRFSMFQIMAAYGSGIW
jgi:hypothetical protein